MDELTTEEEELTSEDSTSTPPISPASSSQLNCGYHCSKYIYSQPITKSSYDSLTKEQREAIKEEYYQSYDHATGIRTAEFLGGAILLFSLFILYKMKCRPVRGRKKSVVETKLPTETSNILQSLELTSSPDIILSEPVNDKDSGCQNGSASTNFSFSRRGSARTETVKPVDLTRFNVGRLSCGNIPCSPSVLWSESLLRPSSVQCMSFSLQQPSSFQYRPIHVRTSEQSNELIDIHIIQPTPNASPRGSKRRLSDDIGNLKPQLSPSTLSIPKSHSCLQSALGSSGSIGAGRTSRGKAVKPRRLSLSPEDCYLTTNRYAQNVELMGSHLVIPNSPSTAPFGRLNPMAIASSTPVASVDLLQSKLDTRRFSSSSTASEHVIEIHKSPEVRRPSTSCHVSWLPVASRQNTGLPLDVNCILIENEDQKVSETRC